MLEPTFEAFEIELQNTLYNLSDPVYVPEVCVFQVLDVQPAEGFDGVRQKLIEVIERGAKSATGSDTAKITFLFKVLQQRFVQSLSQERAAEVLDISARHLRRKQIEAIRALAVRLWSRNQAAETAAVGLESTLAQTSVVGPSGALSWAEMVLREIEVLNSRSLGIITTDLARVVLKTIEMARYMHQKDGISLEIEEISSGIEVAVHPNVLRQVILYIVQQVAQSGFSGEVKLSVSEECDMTTLSFQISRSDAQSHPVIPNIDELAAVLGGRAEIHMQDGCCTLDLVFPKSRKVAVLVVDDNFETAHLYRRFTLNSRYEIFHTPSGFDLLEQIQQVAPDILVIDVLLPGQDGWDLLLQLRQNPKTASLPVIVCSVMGDPETARSLGANNYLPKPVDQKTFLRALEDVA